MSYKEMFEFWLEDDYFDQDTKNELLAIRNNEEEVEDQGLLADMTWEEFKLANGEQVKLEVDTDMYSIVQTATGIPAENIVISSLVEN